MPLHDFILRISTAFALGSLIGFERQWRQRMAGLRTNTLVSVGACLFVLLGLTTPHEGSPTRMAAQVVSGIGFLGGGVILRDGLGIRGLNTAATLWCAAAVGTLCGAGMLLPATIGAVVILGANVLLRPIARKIYGPQTLANASDMETTYGFLAVCRAPDEQHIRALLLQMLNGDALTLLSLSSKDLEDPTKIEVRARLIGAGGSHSALEHIVSRLSLESSISAVSWEIVAREEL